MKSSTSKRPKSILLIKKRDEENIRLFDIDFNCMSSVACDWYKQSSNFDMSCWFGYCHRASEMVRESDVVHKVIKSMYFPVHEYYTNTIRILYEYYTMLSSYAWL